MLLYLPITHPLILFFKSATLEVKGNPKEIFCWSYSPCDIALQLGRFIQGLKTAVYLQYFHVYQLLGLSLSGKQSKAMYTFFLSLKIHPRLSLENYTFFLLKSILEGHHMLLRHTFYCYSHFLKWRWVFNFS